MSNNNNNNSSTTEKNYDFLYKVVVVGDSGIGKSSLILRFTTNKFNLNTKPTIGVDFASKDIMYDNKCIYGHIWDTAGQEKYQAVAPAMYRGALGSLIVFDITNRESFDNLEKWMAQLSKYGESDCINIIIGNKSDLNHLRQVSTEETKEFAQKHNCLFMETSALNSSNVETAFSTLLQKIYLQKPSQPTITTTPSTTTAVSPSNNVNILQTPTTTTTSNWPMCQC